MNDTLGNVTLPNAPLIPGVAAAAPQAAIELAFQPPPALLLAATLSAVVVGRGGNGALLLRTDYGTLALKTPLSLPPGSRVDLKLLPGPPASVMLTHIEAPDTPAAAAASSPLPQALAAAPSAATAAKTPASAAAMAVEPVETPPTQLALGSEVEATVTAPPAGGGAPLPAGTRLLLRVTLPGMSPSPPGPTAGPVPGAATPSRFSGTIAESPADLAGTTILDTPLGSLALDRRLALPPGTTLDLAPVATLPPAASSGQLASATVVSARLVSPPPGAAALALPVGSRLELRVQTLASAATLPADALAGTVVASSAGETMVETALGTLALQRRLALPAGTPIFFEQLAAMPPDQPADEPLAQRTSWPALDETLATLDRMLPELAARLRSDLSPASGQQLAGTLLFLMSALNNGTWPGNKVASALDNAGRRDLRLKLDGDAAQLRELATPQSGDWRVYILPLLDGALVRPVRLYFRRRSGNGGSSEQDSRFVVEVEMSQLGALQLDGLVRPQRLDLVLRSHRPIASELRQEIAEIFRNVSSAAGLAGDITFTTASRFAVAPLDALRAHVGLTA
jgi:hypothetical protein